MVKKIVFAVVFFLSLPVLALSRLDVSVDKNPVMAGEYFVLTLSADDSVSGDSPDTSALLKDFVVGPTSTSSRTSIVNGSISKRTSWQVQLMARDAGEINVPSFEIQGVKSAPFTLKVVNQPSNPGETKDAFIKTSLKPAKLYVQQAGVYTVKLYLARELSDGNLSTPELENAQVSQLGQQQEDYEIIDGKRYLVITRDYLVQPQQSGEFTIKPPVFSGRMRKNYRSFGVSAIAEEMKLDVLPVPDTYKGDWLPSELVALSEEWQPDDNTVEVGTPITRTITLTAVGVTKEQLPEIKLPPLSGIRSYPDENERKHSVRDGRIISQQVASFALLPQKPGNYTLPEVKVPWFNTKTKRMEFATIAERSIQVVAAPGQPSDPSIPGAQPLPQNSQAQNKAAPAVQSAPIQSIHWIITASGYLLWLVTLAAWVLFTRRKTASGSKPLSVNTRQQGNNLEALRRAQKAGDNKAFYQALYDYGVHLTGDHKNPLASLRARVNSAQFNKVSSQLEAFLYGAEKQAPDLKQILAQLESHRDTAKASIEALPPLYENKS